MFEDMTWVVKVELDVNKRTKSEENETTLDSQPSLCVFLLYFVRILRVCKYVLFRAFGSCWGLHYKEYIVSASFLFFCKY